MTNIVMRSNPVRTMNPMARTEPRKPVVDVSEKESGITMTAELPGFGPDDLDIQVKENLLTIRALKEAEKEEEERKAAFERSFVLPEDLKRDSISAEMKNGLLTLELPRQEKPAPLAIKVTG